MKNTAFLALIPVAGLLVCALARADVLELKNGQVLNGTPSTIQLI